ncbi:hydroxyethylthiazole kinase [Anaerotruncus rubiinfantis]|uniref:hydroxyethylthiazole kinase n=1 Tax=Anaerotruncus rubiinfantis TaxID=1720200 RepID=UPI000AEB7DAC|nr:hydroxyethylthiazole kinase [Anaerotruncus rubiinfantis]
MFEKILSNVAAKTPLVHCITNYVTVNDVANILLACGGSPIMADDENEAEEITSICDALALNIGTLNSRTVQSMLKAGRRANALGHPVVLDPVGAGASKLRTDTTVQLLRQVKFTVIRGNSSEIKTVAAGSGETRGVDANAADATTDENLPSVISYAKALSEKTGAIIAITGAIDVAADAKDAYVIRNGHPMMSRITGTGCMLTGVIAAFVAANPQNPLDAAAAAVCAMGICGETAYTRMRKDGGGTASLRMGLIDAMSRLDAKTLKEAAKLEHF